MALRDRLPWRVKFFLDGNKLLFQSALKLKYANVTVFFFNIKVISRPH